MEIVSGPIVLVKALQSKHQLDAKIISVSLLVLKISRWEQKKTYIF